MSDDTRATINYLLVELQYYQADYDNRSRTIITLTTMLAEHIVKRSNDPDLLQASLSAEMRLRNVIRQLNVANQAVQQSIDALTALNNKL
jgi:hypothetical protein